MKLFVPGRICLFGEHSDWAGGYRRFNADIEKGYALICGTNQGIYADVKPHTNKLILKSTGNDGKPGETYEIPMKREDLLAEAEKGGYFSYIAGVAYQILIHYRVHGLEIDNYLTDLPIKKGLSSSAAICVLAARAFNRIYDLKMTVRGEMEFAYLGEITTPSRCGRLDQGCAYGNRPVVMTFDSDRIEVKELNTARDLNYVIVDLQAGKDTKEILSKLNHCYPFAETEIQKNVQNYLGPVNRRIVQDAADAISNGDAEKLGGLMNEAQEYFDAACIPACSSQLKAPVLHKVLSYPALKPYIYGGKGVGSQGDGTAQFLARNKESQKKLVSIIENELKMPCLCLSLSSSLGIRKAVIPAAGYGTRLFPATKSIKKELFPVIDPSGRAKPVILCIIEEALSAGIEEVCVIIQAGDRAVFEDLFWNPPPIEHYNKLSKEDQKFCDYLMEIGHKVTFIEQTLQEGFGHAVYCAKDWVGNEPFLLLLGDHIYSSSGDDSCAAQLVKAYQKTGHSVVGLKKTPAEDVKHFGTAAGIWEEKNTLLTITEFYEKPSADYAREFLQVEDMEEGQFLTVFGQYILSPKIFEYISEQIDKHIREKGEFQLTSCLDRLRLEEGFSGYMVNGRRFDIGLPEAYRETIINYRNS
jgi:UTP-glucose-1-phosphate uridylyltransferase/mevalonate kinase